MSQSEESLRWPQFDRSSEREVLRILRSGRVNYHTGNVGRKFESAFSEWIAGGRKRRPEAVSVSSGTAALHLALEALGIGRGDDVVVTPYSFRASATAVDNAGARPVFADVGRDHMLNAETVEKAITPRTKAVIVVHLYGQVADMGPILALARRRGIKVIEDCAQCLGGEWRGRRVGTLGDVGCFSFCQSKHITAAGEGGMVVTFDRGVADGVRSLRDHGWTVGSQPKAFDRVGYNFRLTEIQSAVALGELGRLDRWNLPRRRRLFEALDRGIRRIDGQCPIVRSYPVDTASRRASFWLVPYVLDRRRLAVPVSEFIEEMQRHGADCYRVMWPLMKELPTARSLIDDTVGFWVHPTYALSDIRRTLGAFAAAIAKFKVQ